jgi:hypothetical protein
MREQRREKRGEVRGGKYDTKREKRSGEERRREVRRREEKSKGREE